MRRKEYLYVKMMLRDVYNHKLIISNYKLQNQLLPIYNQLEKWITVCPVYENFKLFEFKILNDFYNDILKKKSNLIIYC